MNPPDRPEDVLFGDLVVSQGLCSRSQVDECLAVIRRLREAGVTPVPPLGEMLVRRGLLSAPRFEATVRVTPASSSRSTEPSSPTEPPLPPEAASAAADPENVIGKYVRCERIGAGGMGEVWKGWDRHLGRWVALKFLKAAAPEELARFAREAQTTARLSHPNICAIFEVAETSGRPYIAMQFVQGHTFRALPREDPRVLAQLLRDAALAVHAAHELGVIHRDLKPDNLMVEVAGRESSSRRFRVYVMDFGLAKQTAMDSSLSSAGAVLGTPAYMPPEQAQGRLSDVDARSDVYSLGATLYDLLAGRPPFQGENVYQLLGRVSDEDPRPVRSLNPKVSPDLDTIVLKCLEKDPARRYATALEVAEDLGRWLQGEAILAHPPSVFYRLRKRLAKRRGIAVAVAGGFAALGAALVLLLPRLREAGAQKEAAERKAEVERRGRVRSERVRELGVSVLSALADAELNARQGEMKRAWERLDRGIALCREELGREEGGVARFFLGRLLVARGRRKEAGAEFDRAIEKDPSLAEARLERGKILVEDYAAGLQRMQMSVISERDPSRVVLNPSAAFLEERDPSLRLLRERAVAELSVEVREYSLIKEVDALYARAELARMRRDQEGAKKGFDEVLAREPLYVEAFVSQAKMALDRNDLDAAERLAGEAIARHRGFGPAYAIRAEAFWQKRRQKVGTAEAAPLADSAFKDVDKALALGEGTAGTYELRGRAREVSGDDRGAVEDYTRAVEIDPRHTTALEMRARVLWKLGDLEGAVGDYSKVLERGSSDRTALIRAYTNRAIFKDKGGDIQGAVDDCTAAIDLDPATSWAWFCRSIYRERKGDLQGALADLDRTLAIQPGYAEALSRRAGYRAKVGDLDGALADAVRAVEISPREAVHLEGEAWVRGMSADAAMSPDRYARLPAADPKGKGAFAARAWVRARLGQGAEALLDYDRAVELDPKDAALRRMRAATKVAAGDAKGAVEDYDRAIELAPADAELRADRGRARERTGDLKGALEDYGRAVELEPLEEDYYRWRGLAHFKLGDPQKALADLDRALSISPREPVTLRARAMVHQLRGDLDGAMKDARRAEEIDREGAAGEVARAWECHRRGHLRGALDFLEQARRRDPTETHVPLRIWYLGRRTGVAEAAARGRLEAAGPLYLKPEWPAPVFRLYTGASTVEAFLEAELGGDATAERRSQVHFYAAQWHLARGDAAQARPHLEACAGHGTLALDEAGAAAADLSRLGR